MLSYNKYFYNKYAPEFKYWKVRYVLLTGLNEMRVLAETAEQARKYVLCTHAYTHPEIAILSVKLIREE